MDSVVNHPAHYNTGKIEVIDAIHEWQLNFNLGNVVKYIARAGHKQGEDPLVALKKAEFYLRDEINRMEEKPKVIHIKQSGPVTNNAKSYDERVNELLCPKEREL